MPLELSPAEQSAADMSPSNGKRRSTQAKILAAACDVFAERGYHEAHISDIVTRANIARGTFYLYFESKERIFDALTLQAINSLRKMISGVDVSSAAAPVEVQLTNTLRGLMQVAAEDHRGTRIVLRDAIYAGGRAASMMRGFFETLQDYIEKSIEEGQLIGLLRPSDAGAAAICLIGAIKQCLHSVAQNANRENDDLDQRARAVVDFALRGIGHPTALA